MAGAILRGVPATTLDTDLWIECPPREDMRIIRISLRAGARHVADTLVELEDGFLVNFIYSPDGLRSFDREYREAPRGRLA